MRRQLVRRLNKLRTRSLTIGSSGGLSDDPFVIAKSGHFFGRVALLELRCFRDALEW